MPRHITVLRVFVASPGDVKEERAALEQIVTELNLIWGDTHGVQLQLIRWETHATPGLGTDAQEVINRGLGDDYDLFVGMMWGRFGTPTDRAESGTEEEFNRAFERYRRDPNSVDVMFYFKDAGIAPSEMDPEQLRAVQEFRSRLGDEGLYWTFTDLEEFQSFLRIHLSRKVRAWREGHPGELGPTHTGSVPAEPTVSEAVAQAELGDVSELGLLDLIEVSTDAFHESLASIVRMTTDLGAFTAQIRSRTTEMNELGGVADRHKVSLAKRVLRRAAENVNHYSERTNAELPTFASTLQTGIRTFGQALSLATDFGPGAAGQIQTALEQVTKIRASMAGSIEGASGLKDSMASWPRISGDLIKAKKKAVQTLAALVQEMQTGDALLAEVEATLGKWLNDL